MVPTWTLAIFIWETQRDWKPVPEKNFSVGLRRGWQKLIEGAIYRKTFLNSYFNTKDSLIRILSNDSSTLYRKKCDVINPASRPNNNIIIPKSRIIIIIMYSQFIIWYICESQFHLSSPLKIKDWRFIINIAQVAPFFSLPK